MAPKRADELLLVLHDTEKERAHDGSLCFCVGIQDDTRRMNFNSDSVGRSQSMIEMIIDELGEVASQTMGSPNRMNVLSAA